MAMTSAGGPVNDGDPGDEAALELLGIERGEDIAEVIVRRRTIAERPEAAQKRELLVAEAGDIGEGFRPRQHRQQAQTAAPRRADTSPCPAGVGPAGL